MTSQPTPTHDPSDCGSSAWAIPPSPRMKAKGNDYYTCSVCGEKCVVSTPTQSLGDEEQLLTILADYSNDLHDIKMRDDLLPAHAAVKRIEELKAQWEREARIKEHENLWNAVPLFTEHIGTVRDISDLMVTKLKALSDTGELER